MDARESLPGVENLRFRFQMNNRLRLECLAAVSKVFREFSEPIADELLAAVVFALPQELISSNGHGTAPVQQLADDDNQQTQRPGNPPEKPKPGPQPGNPPEKPKPGQQPGNPPEQPKPGQQPGNPPEQPKPGPQPGNPPEQPKPATPYDEPITPAEPDTQPMQVPSVPPEAPEQMAMGYLS
jgi:hypothetical protein